MQDVFVRKPSGIEAFFIDLDECGCNMTFHFYLELDQKPDVPMLNDAMRRMLDTHSGINMKLYRNAWYTTSHVPECRVIEVAGKDLEHYKPSRLDFHKHTVALNILHATQSDTWYLCFDFFHGVVDGRSGIQFVYDFFDVLNDRKLPEMDFTVSDCELVHDEHKPEWNDSRPAFTVLPECAPSDWCAGQKGENHTAFLRSKGTLRSAAAHLSELIGRRFGNKSAKMIIPVDVRRHADNTEKAMFGNLFVPMFLDVKACSALSDMRKEIIDFVKQKPRLMTVAEHINIYSKFPAKLRQTVIRAAIPLVMASKKFIYCALVSALGNIDSEKLMSDAFNVLDYTVTFVSFPFTAFTVISLQFKGRTNTTVSWHSGRVPEETANILMEDITERMNNQVVPG